MANPVIHEVFEVDRAYEGEKETLSNVWFLIQDNNGKEIQVELVMHDNYIIVEATQNGELDVPMRLLVPKGDGAVRTMS